MTEKRFVDDGFEAIEEQSFTDTKTDKTYYVDYFDEIVDLVNQLNNENEQLKKENIQLDERLSLLTIEMVKTKSYEHLESENEQLKEELKIYRKIANCSNCDYHNYDWFDDGDEFEVCDKGNDMSNRICQDWEEL